MNWSTRHSWVRDFFFGGPWSSLGRVPRDGPDGLFPCIFSVRRCRVMRSPGFLHSAIASFTRHIFPHQVCLALSPLEDQECAAALMWTCVTIIFLVPAVLVTLEILSPHRARPREETWASLREISGQPLHTSKLEVI